MNIAIRQDVEIEADQRRPGCTVYRVTGSSRADVQREITRLSDQVDTAFGGVPGCARWSRIDLMQGGRFRAHGEILKFQPEGAAA